MARSNWRRAVPVPPPRSGLLCCRQWRHQLLQRLKVPARRRQRTSWPALVRVIAHCRRRRLAAADDPLPVASQRWLWRHRNCVERTTTRSESRPAANRVRNGSMTILRRSMFNFNRNLKASCFEIYAVCVKYKCHYRNRCRSITVLYRFRVCQMSAYRLLL